MSSLAPPPLPKHGTHSMQQSAAAANGENTDDSAFSVSAAKAFFEAAKKPEVRNAASSLAKNSYVQSMAKSAAQNPETRKQIAQAISNPTPAQKMAMNAALASASASSSAPVPPPPPHRATSTSNYSSMAASKPAPPIVKPSPPPSTYSSTSASYAPSKSIASSHSSIMSKLEGLHLGGQPPMPQPARSAPARPPLPSVAVPSFSSSASAPVPPPVPVSSHPYNLPTPAPTYDSTSYSKPSSLPTSTFVSPSEPHAIARYPFSPSQFDELGCAEGDTILLKKEVDSDWIYGMNTTTGKHGIVPIAFLEIKVPLVPTSTVYAGQGQANLATALYDYASATPGDLQFRANEQIKITGKVDDQWLEGEVAGQRGIFPLSFVHFQGDISRLPYIQQPQQQTAVAAAGSYNSPPLSLDVYSGKKKKEFLIGAFSYMSGIEGDLQFSKGDEIEVLERLDEGWIRGKLYGREGLAPLNYLIDPKTSPKNSGLSSLQSIAGKKAVATANNHNTEPGHLFVSKGDELVITDEENEFFYKGKSVQFRALPEGLIPKSIVKFV